MEQRLHSYSLGPLELLVQIETAKNGRDKRGWQKLKF